jgi:D-alanyl-D-alanine carboxypeptidase/D-alanyl-D-alanine-endopeptidase (penicillin-binding protein 4)
MIGRRALIGGFVAGIAAAVRPVWAEAPSVVPRPQRRPEPGEDRALNRLIEAANLSGALAYVVADRATGRVLASKDASLPLPPASVAKAITSLYALEQLGPAFRFRTRLMRQGPVVNGRLEGDLFLVGGGDPNLDTDDLGDLAAALAATGLRAVTGRFIACDGALPTHARIAADQPDHLGYNPAISGLNLNYNRVHFEWKPTGQGWQLAMDARGERFVPPVAGVKVALAARELPIFAYEGSDASERWTVAEPALGEGGSRWLPVRRPAPHVAEVFATLAAAHGLMLPPADIMAHPPADAVEIVAHEGDELTAVLADMLRFSTNLTAEAVGLMASGAGSLLGSGAAMSDWARRRFGLAARFVDHSGLGVQSAITAEDLVKVMLRADAARHGDLLAGLMREKGLADDEGTELKSNPVRIHAKSGTLNFVSNLAGYVAAPGGELAFAIIAADPTRRAAVPMEEREQPKGGRSWTRRARRLHHQLIRAWSESYL